MRRVVVLAIALGALGSAIAAPLVAGEGARSFRATLSGFNEVPTLSVAGTGSFTAKLNADESELSWTLSYSDLTGNPTMAHIHFGATGTAGGISVWLCDSETNPGPANISACPTSTSGSISGVSSAADVVGPAGQGLAAGQWDEFVRAVRAGTTYANMHTVQFPPGEIRGRLSPGEGN